MLLGHAMKKLFLVLIVFCFTLTVAGQDITKLEHIGPVVSFTKSEKGVALRCADDSEVQVTVLAPDLVRLRASFGKPLPARDHSWAIAKTDWTTPAWSLSEVPGSIIITTDEVEVLIQRSPLLVTFRDAKTHVVINADERPMVYDAKGVFKKMLFDPRSLLNRGRLYRRI